MRLLIAIGVVLAAMLLVAAPASAQCTCPTTATQGGWCDDCGLGYVKPQGGKYVDDKLGGLKDPTGKLGDAKDSAGKAGKAVAAKLESIKCRDCYEAASSVQGGFCTMHATGYIGGKQVKCQECVAAAHGKNDGWCEACKSGYAKGVKSTCRECLKAIRDDDGGWCDSCGIGHDGALETRCKSCFDAMKKDDGGWCDKCSLGFASGHQTSCKGCFAALQKDDGGWCDSCGTGFVQGTQTWCKSCFPAMQKDGSCTVCKVEFKDGAVCRRLQFTVAGLDAKDRADDLEDALDKLAGTKDIKIDKDKETVTLLMCDSSNANSHDAYVVVRRSGCEVKKVKTG